jgi:hypothetical protein
MKLAIALGIAAAALGGGLTASLVQIDRLGDEALDLRAEVKRIKSRLRAVEEARPAPATPVDLRAIERRLERLEAAAPASPATHATAAPSRPVATDRPVDAALPAAAVPALQAEPVRKALQEMLQSGVKRFHEQRRAQRWQKRDERIRTQIAAFGKQQGLTSDQIEQLGAILQDSRDRRREIRRQVAESEIEIAAARKQIEDLRTSTRDQVKQLLGEKGYEAYQSWRREVRQTWRSLWRF